MIFFGCDELHGDLLDTYSFNGFSYNRFVLLERRSTLGTSMNEGQYIPIARIVLPDMIYEGVNLARLEVIGKVY